PGVFVPLSETLESFDAICKGEFDHLPEQAFSYVGNIEDAEKKAESLAS
ncbi:MAG: F0F1 ATP synthase subunit beta, partial [Jiangellaceae bacterium]